MFEYENCEFLICGDFYARVGERPDFVLHDTVHVSVENVLPDDYVQDVRCLYHVTFSAMCGTIGCQQTIAPDLTRISRRICNALRREAVLE
ncbi:hypothetical protein DPMN_194048 [Dreissena polymorpha]|uniref:Uncharacterized protein n=1 Tax=Dreissena polymorpha TaxID=45954 RepID=A0A9D3Y1S5_DREPO|nr:hypothetical protein DPMN_194048 [Dreissena polymorpha]